MTIRKMTMTGASFTYYFWNKNVPFYAFFFFFLQKWCYLKWAKQHLGYHKDESAAMLDSNSTTIYYYDWLCTARKQNWEFRQLFFIPEPIASCTKVLWSLQSPRASWCTGSSKWCYLQQTLRWQVGISRPRQSARYSFIWFYYSQMRYLRIRVRLFENTFYTITRDTGWKCMCQNWGLDTPLSVVYKKLYSLAEYY